MARCDNWSLGGFGHQLYMFNTAKYAMMYRFVMREHCEITPDRSIPENLAMLHLNPRDSESYVDCFCCYCRNYASIIAGPGTIDSSDSVFAESNTWSDESDIQVDDIQVESPELIRQNTFNDSDSLFSNDSGDTDLPNALCSDSQYCYDYSEYTGHDLSQLMDPPLTEQSEDDSQWQSVSDIVGQLPVDQTGLSFSDAETQFPINGESFSDAETQRPDDLHNVPLPVIRLRFPSDEESDSSDSSSHSERVLKRRK